MLMLVALSLGLSGVAGAESLKLIQAKAGDTSLFSASDKDYKYSFGASPAPVGTALFTAASIPAKPDFSLMFCTSWTFLGVQNGSMVVGYKDYSVVVDAAFRSALVDSSGALAGTIYCNLGEVYKVRATNTLYIPKGTTMALSGDLRGHTLTVDVNSNFEATALLK